MDQTEAWRLFMDQVDQMDLMDKMGGASVYPEGLRGAVWFGAGADLPVGKTALPTGITGESRGGQPDPLWRGSNVAPLKRLFLPSFFHFENYPRALRGLSGGQFSPPDRSGNAPDRYMAFFAKLFFTWKKSGERRRYRRRWRYLWWNL